MIVTISREYGTAASEVAHELGTILGYRVAGENFSKMVEARLGTPGVDIEAVGLRVPRLVEWVLGHVLGPPGTVASPQTFEEKIRDEIETAVFEAAAEGNVVIIGGVSNIVLRDRSDTVSVFLHAPLPYRVGRVQASTGMGADEARDEILRVDSAKRRWAKTHYNLEWGSVWDYDLAIDVSHLGITGTARLIASAVSELQGVT
jgi:cytidylate kinase